MVHDPSDGPSPQVDATCTCSAAATDAPAQVGAERTDVRATHDVVPSVARHATMRWLRRLEAMRYPARAS